MGFLKNVSLFGAAVWPAIDDIWPMSYMYQNKVKWWTQGVNRVCWETLGTKSKLPMAGSNLTLPRLSGFEPVVGISLNLIPDSL